MCHYTLLFNVSGRQLYVCDRFAVSPLSRRTSLSSEDLSRLRKLEEEQEHLNNSLMALTTHFAQVRSDGVSGISWFYLYDNY